MPKQMHLALDVSWTQVETAWRMPGSWVGRHYPDIGLFEDIAQIADYLEEMFDATGSRGGFMLGHSQCGPRDLLHDIVDPLVPELQRRGRFRTGRTLRANLAG